MPYGKINLRYGPTLAQVMASCLTASSHYLDQNSLITRKVQWHSSEGDLTRHTSATNNKIRLKITFIQLISFKSPRVNELSHSIHLSNLTHDDVIKWKYFPRYWPFVRGIHRSPVNSPYKGQWRGALRFSLISVWINGRVNNHEAGDLRHHHAHYDVIVMT